jgi:heme-degrading monooxygenase HmoA
VIVSIVRFRSRLSRAEVQSLFEQRADRYRQVPGLVEKIYLEFGETGEFGAVYVWDSEASLERFRASDLARSISAAYEVEGETRVELADVMLAVQHD